MIANDLFAILQSTTFIIGVVLATAILVAIVIILRSTQSATYYPSSIEYPNVQHPTIHSDELKETIDGLIPDDGLGVVILLLSLNCEPCVHVLDNCRYYQRTSTKYGYDLVIFASGKPPPGLQVGDCDAGQVETISDSRIVEEYFRLNTIRAVPHFLILSKSREIIARGNASELEYALRALAEGGNYVGK